VFVQAMPLQYRFVDQLCVSSDESVADAVSDAVRGTAVCVVSDAEGEMLPSEKREVCHMCTYNSVLCQLILFSVSLYVCVWVCVCIYKIMFMHVSMCVCVSCCWSIAGAVFVCD